MLPENFPFCLFESMEVENKRLITKLRTLKEFLTTENLIKKQDLKKQIPALLL